MPSRDRVDASLVQASLSADLIASLLNRHNQPNKKSVARLDAGRLDDRPPLVQLGLVVGGERLRVLLIGREYDLAEGFDFRPRGGIGQRLHDGGIEALDDGLGSVLGGPQAMPE